MAVNNFTVADFLRRLNIKLRRHAGSIDTADKVAALEEAQQEVWSTLLRASAAWFVAESQNVTSGNDDFFPVLVPATREYSLPKNFHQMYYVDVFESGQEDLEFLSAYMDATKYKKKRRSGAATNTGEKEYYYDVVGTNPSRFVMAQALPTTIASLDVKLFYVKILDRLADETDSIDDTILPFIGPATSYAASMLAAGVGAEELSSYWMKHWMERKSELPLIANRLLADAPIISGHSGDLPPKRAHVSGKV